MNGANQNAIATLRSSSKAATYVEGHPCLALASSLFHLGEEGIKIGVKTSSIGTRAPFIVFGTRMEKKFALLNNSLVPVTKAPFRVLKRFLSQAALQLRVGKCEPECECFCWPQFSVSPPIKYYYG